MLFPASASINLFFVQQRINDNHRYTSTLYAGILLFRFYMFCSNVLHGKSFIIHVDM